MKINDNFEKLPESYLFSEVAHRLADYREQHPDADLIRMDIGDVTLPILPCVVEAMHRAVDEMAHKESFRGYGPEQGYLFLRQAIADNDYHNRGIDIDADEIFISDGAKCDLGNLGDIYASDSIVAVADPGYPVYADTAVMSGRAGSLSADGRWSRLLYLDCNADNGFKPAVPAEHADVVILCSPANPTGTVLTHAELKAWVDYARREHALIIFDSAYEAFITDSALPRSIYEIEGADTVAIEVRSFSKTAGFTGLRCGYTVVPKALKGTDEHGNEVSLRKLWNRRQSTKFNGASYIVQRGAEALYTLEGREGIQTNIAIYLDNARAIRRELQQAGFTVFGGEHSPYVWVKSPESEPAGLNARVSETSWQMFSRMLEQYNISCTPGVGFGTAGEGYIRLTGFNTPDNTRRALGRIRN